MRTYPCSRPSGVLNPCYPWIRVLGPDCPCLRPVNTAQVHGQCGVSTREDGPWARVVCVYEPWVRDWWDVTDSWSEPAGKPAERRRLWWFRRRLQRGCFNSVLDCLSVIQRITLLAVLYKYVSEPICFSWYKNKRYKQTKKLKKHAPPWNLLFLICIS